MSLSLEVKKFVNSESMGDFVTIMLPGEKTAENADIRAFHNDLAATKSATHRIRVLEEKEKLARVCADDAQMALEAAKQELAEHDQALSAQMEALEELKAEHTMKRETLDRAKRALDRAKAQKTKLSTLLSEANENVCAAEKAEKEAAQTVIILQKAEAVENGPEAGERNGSGEKNEASNLEKELRESNAQFHVKACVAAANRTESCEAAADEKEQHGEIFGKNRDDDHSARIRSAEKVLENANFALNEERAERDELQKALERTERSVYKMHMEYGKLMSEFDKLSALLEVSNEALECAERERSEASEHLEALEQVNDEAKARLFKAQQARKAAQTEAEDLIPAKPLQNAGHGSTNMHYLESGRGETMLLIHTAGQSLFTFRNVFHKLAMNYHVIAVDLIGHGCSDRPNKFDYTIASHAASLVSFMNALGIERAHLVGFSMGAGYALEMARSFPERVMSVVALSPGGVTNTMPLPIRMMDNALFGSVASRLFSVKTVEKLLDDCLFDHTVIGAHEVGEYYKCVSDVDSRRAIRRSVSSFDEKALLASLSQVEHDVLILLSDNDRWHTQETCRIYHGAIRNCSLKLVRNAGHLMHEEKPERIVALVRSFIPAGYGDYDGMNFD